MRILLLLIIVAGLGYGCSHVIKTMKPDYTANVFSYQIGNNFVSRAEADGPNCIWLNTNFGYDYNNTIFSNGTYDTIDGRPVCGYRADIVTTDGKKYVAFFNRFKADPAGRLHSQAEFNESIANGVVKCYTERKKCYAGTDGMFGPSKEVHGPF